jgi:hypothetical protein
MFRPTPSNVLTHINLLNEGIQQSRINALVPFRSLRKAVPSFENVFEAPTCMFLEHMQPRQNQHMRFGPEACTPIIILSSCQSPSIVPEVGSLYQASASIPSTRNSNLREICSTISLIKTLAQWSVAVHRTAKTALAFLPDVRFYATDCMSPCELLSLKVSNTGISERHSGHPIFLLFSGSGA